MFAGAAFALGLSLAPRVMLGVWSDPSAGSPIIQSHDLAEASTQGPAWAFADTAHGTLLVGADHIAEYDGHRWRKISVPGGYAIRGMAREIQATLENGSRIYFGAIGGLGYVDFDRYGRSTLTSLVPQLKDAGFKLPAEFWQVQSTEHGILFVSDQEILRWIPEPGPTEDAQAHGKFEQWSLPSEPRLQAFPVGRDLWFFQTDVGLRRIGPNGPETLVPTSDLPEKAFVWALPGIESPTGEGLLLGTSNAVYVRRNSSFVKLEALSAAIAGKLPVCAVPLDAEHIALGTYLAGVMVVTRSGQVSATIDRSHGLPDDHVESLWLDGQGILWAGLTEAIARVTMVAAVSRFDARNGLSESPVKEVVAQGTETFAITSKSVFSLHQKEANQGSAAFTPEPGLNAFFWDATAAGEHLLMAGYGGIWVKSPAGWKPPPPEPDKDSFDTVASATTTVVSPAGWRHEYYVSGEVTFLLATRPDRPLVLFTEGKAIKALEMTASGWVPRDLQQQLSDTPLSMALDGKGDLWVSMVRGSIARFSLQFDRQHRPFLLPLKVLIPGEGLPAETERPRLQRVGTELFAFATSGILRLNNTRTMFALDVSMAGFTGLAAAQSKTGTAYWLVHRKSLGDATSGSLFRMMLETDGALNRQPLAVDGLATIGRPASLSITDDDGREVLWIAGSSSLLQVRTSELAPAPPAPEAYVRAIEIEGHEANDIPLALPARSERVRLELAARGAASADTPPFYQTRLVGLESEWSAPSLTSERAYTGLPPGHYTFLIRAADLFGRIGPEYALPMTVATPLWWQWPALAAYALTLIACIILGVRWRLRVLKQDTVRLNRLVEERTQDLAERTKELELSNTAKEEFLENISHEIRNPLNGVRGLAGMLRETPLPSQQRELTASLAACASALTRVFDEVLNFAKLEAGQKPVQKRAFSLPTLIDEVIALHRVTARQRGSEISASYEEVAEDRAPDGTGSNGNTPPPSRRFVGDDDRIKTIISNFVSNALKYAPGKPLEIAVECRPEGKRSCDVTIAVRDRGAGVPWEEQPLVFNKFVRGSNAKAQRVPGTGLGLATCKALAEQMGAFVGLDSEPGKGASFFLKVQLRREPDTTEPESLVESSPVATKSRRALVIEDQDYNQLITLRIAQKLGLEPEIAQDGTEAMRKFAHGAYAVLFVDWEMPGLKGNEIARHVRQLPWGTDAVIIATTGHDSEAVRAACFEAGMDAFVVKPFDEESMARALESARARRGQATDLPVAANRLNLRVFSLVGEDDPTKIERAAVDYLASMQDELTAIDFALAAGDYSVAAGAAHRLKSHAGFVSATELQQAAEAFEQTVEQAEPESRTRLRDNLFAEADRVRLQVQSRVT